ncbi:hypothetical protein KKC1_17050 [Calderihabitans maritimus]|uniref:Uncharacterized protein n=1 Tax=Calderihabitans maritimus TaxID=1246530 RepID=A0A1Z5HTA2_9FIRM|nr:hypothetical protein KKC1_17050 [Calderihabitans maritimus]
MVDEEGVYRIIGGCPSVRSRPLTVPTKPGSNSGDKGYQVTPKNE